jgi:hypothetical protein
VSGSVRVWALALAFVMAGCVARTTVSAPSPEPSPSPTAEPTAEPTATPRPDNASTDVLYVRQQPGGGQKALIAIVDARTGAVKANLPNGALSPDRKLLYSTESADGGTRTIVHVQEIDTAKELRTFSLEGDLSVALSDDGQAGGVARDGKRLILQGFPVQRNGKWMSNYAVLDTTSGALLGRIELAAVATYGFVALSSDRVALLRESGNGTTTLRAFDMAAQAFLPDPAIAGWDGKQVGYRTPFLPSADGRWLFAFDNGVGQFDTVDPFVIALDVAARRAVKIALPREQGTTDFEKYLLWTLALAPDGSSLYVSNAELGFVNEIDAKQPALRRTQRISRPVSGENALARVRQALFPVAEAKRYLRGGAAISPDGRWLYTVGDKGIHVIQTATLRQTKTLLGDKPFGSLALSPDGMRLYAIHDDARRITILPGEGACLQGCTSSLGQIDLFGFLESIVRIDAR